jgi:hypothetical protein
MWLRLTSKTPMRQRDTRPIGAATGSRLKNPNVTKSDGSIAFPKTPPKPTPVRHENTPLFLIDAPTTHAQWLNAAEDLADKKMDGAPEWRRDLTRLTRSTHESQDR